MDDEQVQEEAVFGAASCHDRWTTLASHCCHDCRGGRDVSAIVLVQGERGGFKILNGRWLRLDGGYIFEIRAIDPSGKIDGLYFNPRPINIAKAEATRDGSKLNVFVELRAPNYPAVLTRWCTIGSRTNSEGPIFRRL